MRTTLFKISALALILAALTYIVKIHAQPMPRKSDSVSTNWVGCLVVGKDETLDPLARGPFPATVQRVEIGLRSDGVVVWRSAGGGK